MYGASLSNTKMADEHGMHSDLFNSTQRYHHQFTEDYR
jgi:hypothetical protein